MSQHRGSPKGLHGPPRSALPIPDGHRGDETTVDPDAGPSTSLGATEMLELSAVGAAGRDPAQGPLRAFADHVAP